MSDSNDASVPNRGTIIVTNSALHMLCGFASPGLLKPDASFKRYADIIPWLADQGYHIVIPEMVAREIADMLADGECLSNFFLGSNSGRLSDSFLVKLHKSMYPVLSDWLKHPNVEFVPVADGEKMANEINHIKELIGGSRQRIADYKYSKHIKRNRSHALQTTENETRRAIAAFHKSFPAHENWGEKSIKHLLSTRYAKTSPPVFVLSESQTFCDAYPVPVLPITCSSLFQGLADVKLHSRFGIKTKTSGYSLDMDMQTSSAEFQSEPLIIKDIGDEEKYMNPLRESPFYQSLKQLADDLGKPIYEMPQVVQEQTGESDQVRKYREREAKRLAMQRARGSAPG